MTDSIEFIYQPDCPNVDAARAALRQALVAAGKEPRWREWNSTVPACPPPARAYGSRARRIRRAADDRRGAAAQAHLRRVLAGL